MYGHRYATTLPYCDVVPFDKETPMATSVKLNDELKGRVEQLAGQRRRSAHWIMREAIRQYVDREEARESFKQEALASWAEYQTTGQHLTGGEVLQWLTTWGNDAELDLPACHD